jgi:hypothetical protein
MATYGDTRLPERIWSKISVDESGCWVWLAYRNRGGYGCVSWEGMSRLAYRITYTELVSPVPEGLELDHLCRVRHCVNPDHLEPVTRQTNALRGVGVGAKNAKKTHCPKGHPLSGDNLLPGDLKRGGRKCRQCHRSETNARRAAKRANPGA